MTLEQRATHAAQLAGHASMWLHAAIATEDREQKREWLANGFRSWSLAARYMGLLESLAPNCAREGYDQAARIGDVVEAQQG
jgi:hypothetical protein